MAKSKKHKIDVNDVIDVTPVVIDDEPAEEGEASPDTSLVVQDTVHQAVAEVERKAREIAVEARARDLETIKDIESVTQDMLEGFKGIEWSEIIKNRPKDAAIAYGILMDKREKLLSYDAARPSRRKKRTTFIFDFANQKAAVTVDGDGE